MRAHDAVRRDLIIARHRVSKLLLRHGRVYPEASTWTTRHRCWLEASVLRARGHRGCFHGIDTLTAFALHLELGGNWQRFARSRPGPD